MLDFPANPSVGEAYLHWTWDGIKWMCTELVGARWTQRVSPIPDQSWTSVVYGNGQFVAVGWLGVVMTSPDGINWTRQANGPSAYYSKVIYANGLFVAVGYAFGTIMTSPDGINWTAASGVPTGVNWGLVAYGNGTFVAVSGSPAGNLKVLTSPDGLNWTSQATPGPANVNWSGITFGNGQFVVISSRTNLISPVMISTDGINWTYYDTDPVSNAQSWGGGIVYGKGLFVALSSDNVVSGPPNSDQRVMTSPDGITWTLQTHVAGFRWNGIDFDCGIFVVSGYSTPGNQIMTSPDGVNWTLQTTPQNTQQWCAAAFGAARFVTIALIPSSGGSAGNLIMTSP